MRLSLIQIIFLLFITSITLGQGSFVVTQDITDAYQNVMNLQLDLAAEKIEAIKKTDPENLLVYHVENYVDFFKVFINEEKEEYEALRPNRNKRLAMIQSGDESSPYYKFVQAEIILQWLLLKTKFDGMKDIGLAYPLNKAYRLLERNNEEFPDFDENKKSLAIIHAMAGYAPRWLTKLLKVRASLQLGISEIKELSEACETKAIMYEPEVHAIHAYMLYHLLNKKEEAWQVLEQSGLDTDQSMLANFLFASFGIKTGRNEQIIDLLERRPVTKNYAPFYYLDFVLGKAKLNKLEVDADVHLKKYIDHFKGRHFIKEAYQKLAWYELAVKDNQAGYQNYMSLCQSEGYKDLGDDKQAHKEAKSGIIPNTTLLQSRLLYDGGYYQRAYDLLLEKEKELLSDISNVEEHVYRSGRVAQSLDLLEEAVVYYNKTIAAGSKAESFFACNAALQAGLIMEDQKKYKAAERYFEVCKKIDSPVYKSELHNKANTGLERISALEQ